MDKKQLRIVFMGTPEISAYVFQAMIDDGYHFVGLIAQPDKPIGRKKEIVPVPTKVVALKHHIPVFQPLKIRLDYEFAKALKPDVIVTLAYGQIVPQGLLDIPTHGCINLHGSLLPSLRGASPMQYALIHGLKETGITLMQMIDKMDAGLMYASRKVAVDPEETMTTLTEKFKVVAKELILTELPHYIDGKLPGKSQDESLVTFAPLIKPDAEHLNLSLPVQSVVNWTRALTDHPGGYLLDQDLKIKIYKARVANTLVSAPVGTVVKADKDGLLIQGIDGQMAILELQKEGRKRVDYKAFVNGNSGLLGGVLK
ncbi:MAG: methionyl-tRNA formyltransferase [Firmicutes bacterium]|nr:methionyl-tRNA formyltransferase [Bacillota bacterium]